MSLIRVSKKNGKNKHPEKEINCNRSNKYSSISEKGNM
jgi:hypothetical protein